jgi:protein SCO1/2
VPKIISRIQNGEIVKGIVWTMLKIQMYQMITRIGPAPKFELINQDGLKITNESYKGKVYVLEFSLLPALLFVLK